MISAPVATDQSSPPIAWLSCGALALVVVGGIWMASYALRRPSLSIATTFFSVAVLLSLSVVIFLVCLKDFVWRVFVMVFKWALLAYVIKAEITEFSFVRNYVNGSAMEISKGMSVVLDSAWRHQSLSQLRGTPRIDRRPARLAYISHPS